MYSKANGASRSPSSAKGEVVKAVTSRRVLTYASVFTVALALAVLTPGASAVSKCEPLSTTSFTDPAGDGSGANAPDITDVTVSSSEGGGTTFEIALADQSEFSTDMLVRVFVDSDKNASTGNDKGFEYLIQTQRAGVGDYEPAMTLSRAQPAGAGDEADSAECEDQPVEYASIGNDKGFQSLNRMQPAGAGDEADSAECEPQSTTTLFEWSGSDWDQVETESLSSWYGDSSLTVQINASELGDALAFNFAVYAASNVSYDEEGAPQLADASFDWAPDTGTYSYQPFESSTYSDPVGDGAGTDAPDITKVVVTKWKDALLKFWVAIPETAEFGEDMLIRVYVDSDGDASTGDARGYDYMIQAQRASYDWAAETSLAPMLRGISGLARSNCYQPSLRLFEWSESSWTASVTDSIDWSYQKGLKFSIDPADLGDTEAFKFAVYAATKVDFDDSGSPSPDGASFDWAPDTDSYAFPLVVENAQLQGTYKVVYKVTRSHNFGNLKRGSVSARNWKFVRSCKKHKCATKVVAGGNVGFKLSRSGKSYKGKVGRKFDCQAGFSARGSESYQLRVQKSRWIKGKWRVAKWAGTVRVVSPDNHVPECGGAASYTASLTGTLK